MQRPALLFFTNASFVGVIAINQERQALISAAQIIFVYDLQCLKVPVNRAVSGIAGFVAIISSSRI
jgi:hypothetical protein